MALVFNPTGIDVAVRHPSLVKVGDVDDKGVEIPDTSNPHGEVILRADGNTEVSDEVAVHAATQLAHMGVTALTGDTEKDAPLRAWAAEQAYKWAVEHLRFVNGAIKLDKNAEHTLPSSVHAQKVVDAHKA